LLPRLEALLREIDQERDVFEQRKQEATHDLRDQLNLLRLDASAVDEAIAQLYVVTPRYLDLLPRASSLIIPTSETASLCVPVTAGPLDDALDRPEADTSSQTAASHTLTPGTSSQSAQSAHNQTASTELCVSPLKPLNFDSQVQSQVIAADSLASCSSKRPGIDGQNESDAPYKRQRMANETVCRLVFSCHERLAANKFWRILQEQCNLR
jgi:hypothetical protein